MTPPPDSADRERVPPGEGLPPREDLPYREDLIDDHQRTRGGVEEFARGEIRSYHGIVNRWLLATYVVLAAWGAYYLFKYWGALGPGLAR
jgi:hypothetical protein